MGEAFIVRRGGAPAFAVIGVTYPAGSVCTCTKGTKTLRAKDTSGSFPFLIPEAGTWIVSCTDGTRTKSQNVVIDRQYQAENVVLAYARYIYNAGDEYIDITGGWQVSNLSSGRASKESGWLNVSTLLSADYRQSAVGTISVISRGDANHLKANVEVLNVSGTSKGFTLGLAPTVYAEPSFSYSVITKVTGLQTLDLDISSYSTDNLHVIVCAHAIETHVFSVWLE